MTKNLEHDSGGENQKTKDKQLWRDLVGFWILGLCTNFGYVVMLSAAHDINALFDKTHVKRAVKITHEELQRQCNIVSTGAILLADVVPGLVIKMLIPFLPFWVNVRVMSAISLTIASFLLIAFADSQMMAVMGVVCTSISCGIGEPTLLAYTSQYNRHSLSTWSSGTGGAGLIGSIVYAGLIGLGLSSRDTMLILLAIPALQCVTFWVILRKPPVKIDDKSIDVDPNTCELEGLGEKIKYMRELLRYMCPLLFVFFFHYFINQGLYELEYFDNTFLDKESQYRWLSADYQIGVFISRSSVEIVDFRAIWVFAVLQFINVVYFLTEVIYYYTPNIWITFAIVLWEGLVGGGAYVNTFNRIIADVPKARQKFAIGITVQATSLGIMLSGFLAIPVHNAICRLPEYDRLTFS